MEDHNLFLKIKKGDDRAFEELFRKYFYSLLEYANFYLSSYPIAEDIVHDVFFRIWEKRKSLDIHTSVKSYLFKSIHNNCIQHLRHQKVVRQHSIEHKAKLDEALIINRLFLETGLTRLFEEEINDLVDTALSKLPQKTCEIYNLSRKQHKKNAEIAEIYDLTEKAVEYHITKALIFLRRELKDYLP